MKFTIRFSVPTKCFAVVYGDDDARNQDEVVKGLDTLIERTHELMQQGWTLLYHGVVD